MNMVPVTSSNIKAVGYDAVTKTMAIQFLNGTTYQYANVTPEDHEKMMKSDSKGVHFYKHVKGKFDFTRQEERK